MSEGSDSRVEERSSAKTVTPITAHLRRMILSRRGDNRKLAEDIKLLPAHSQDRLYRVLQELEQDALSERSKRRRGQFF